MYDFPRWERWRTCFCLRFFPYLITGFVTASGGAWNASIVAEYFRFRGPDFFGDGPWRGDQPRYRRGELSHAAGGHHRDGHIGCHREPLLVAATLPPRLHEIQLRELGEFKLICRKKKRGTKDPPAPLPLVGIASILNGHAPLRRGTRPRNHRLRHGNCHPHGNCYHRGSSVTSTPAYPGRNPL